MFNARFFLALMIVAGAALAACSGNFGAGTSSPGGLLPSGPLSNLAATSTPLPTSASNIVTYGDSAAFQPLPQAAGYGGAIAFEIPSPRPSGFQAVPIGATLAIAAPTDAPDLNLASAGKNGKKRDRRARPLVYVTLLATRDVTLASYPRLAIDVPRDIVTTYREDEINVALYNSGAKDKTYRLSVAEHDLASPPPAPSPGHTAPPPPSSIPVSASSPGALPSAPSSVPAGFPTGALTPGPAGPGGGALPLPGASPLASPTLPPQRILFAGTATPLKLTANRSTVFAVYAIPSATSSPVATGSAAARASVSPEPQSSGASPASASSVPSAGAPASSAPSPKAT